MKEISKSIRRRKRPRKTKLQGLAKVAGLSTPRFNLAPLTKLDPAAVVPPHGNDRFAMFMLALAVVFNDVKGIYLLAELIAPLEPKAGEVSGHSGEWRGLELQLHRQRVGIIHELLNLIDKFESEATGDQMNRLLRSAPKGTRSDWKALLEIAIGKNTTPAQTFARQLLQIRNSVAFHYHQPKMLVVGFRKYFFDAPKHAANEHAYCSIGQNMEGTRFFFGDAAIDGALTLLQDSAAPRPFLRTLVVVSEAVNETLKYILEAYTFPARRP